MSHNISIAPHPIFSMDSYEFVEWDPPARSLPIDRVLTGDDAIPDVPWIVDLHIKRKPELIHSLGCFYLRNLQVSGRGHLCVDGGLLVTPEVMPFYWLDSLKSSNFFELTQEASLPIRTITTPTLVITGHGVNVYGHVLIEMLFRLQLSDALGIRNDCPDILVPADAPFWFRAILRNHFGVSANQMQIFDPMRERVLLTDAFVPTLPWKNEQFHPATASLFSALRDRLGIGSYAPTESRLGLTRQSFSNPASIQRSIQNEAALLDIAREEFRVSIFAPETLSWKKQVMAFTEARIIVGSFGSGLHNALFSQAGTKIAIFGFLNMVQSEIAALNNQTCCYIPRLSLDGSFDPEALRNILSQWVET